MSTKINYIVANYIGNNRRYKSYRDIFSVNPLFFFKRHIEFFNANNIPEIECTFVFNDDISEQLKKEILDLTNNKHEVIFRKNAGFSYGAWDQIIKMNLEKYDYFFLIEDDYLPTTSDFLQPFMKSMTDDTAYVCGLVEWSPTHYLSSNCKPFLFPSISNGLLSAAAAKHVLKTFNELFMIGHGNDYQSGFKNQVFFAKHFNDLNYSIKDILSEYRSDFFDSGHNNIVIYGDKNSIAPIEPIVINEY